MSGEARQLFQRADEWVTWYNYNKPNHNAGLEQRVAFLEKANFGALELITRLVELVQALPAEEEHKVMLPTGVILHE